MHPGHPDSITLLPLRNVTEKCNVHFPPLFSSTVYNCASLPLQFSQMVTKSMRWWLEANVCYFQPTFFFLRPEPRIPFSILPVSSLSTDSSGLRGHGCLTGCYNSFSAWWLQLKFLGLIWIPPLPAQLPVLLSQFSSLTTLSISQPATTFVSNQSERKLREGKLFCLCACLSLNELSVFVQMNYPSLELWLI